MRVGISSKNILILAKRGAKRAGLFAMVVVCSAAFLMPASASAAGYKGYDGTVNKKTVNVDLVIGETKTITLTYTNTGTKTWVRGTKTGQVALNVDDGASPELRTTSWLNAETPGTITAAKVAPKKSTTVTFKIKATKAGTFIETLRLASQNTAWMRGTDTVLTVTAHKKGEKVPVAAAAPAPSAPAVVPATNASASSGAQSSTPQAILLLRSSNSRDLTLGGGETATITLGFKNAGTIAWTSRALRLATVQTALADSTAATSWVKDVSWQSPTDAVVEQGTTAPGEIGFLTFTIKAPPKKGNYTVRFALVADGKQVDNAFIDIPITVTSDSSYDLPTPTSDVTSTPSTTGDIPNSPLFQSTEPIIRVGLFATTDDRMQVKGVTTPYEVRQGDTVICSMKGSDVLTVSYDRTHAVYKLDGTGCVGQSTDPYRVVASAGDWSPLEMADYSRPVSWLPGANDNTFRGILELRYTPATDKVWTINELPIEMYLRGLAETSDASPIEFQRALLTAARTYAYYHWTRGTKHEEEFYTVDSKFDQVYRGYGAEARSPKIVQGVEDTRGQIVTYNGSLAITPYFSRSDGRTRSWGEVWAGGDQYPWLVSVPVPEDAGKTLWGHGVGMSASGALGMANEGIGYRDILTHFYTGTGLMKFY